MKVNYLTPEAFNALREELKKLLDIERPQTVEAVSAAAAMGDRSENAEYIYGKRRLREIDRRIRFLQSRLENVEVIDPKNIDVSSVRFACWVKIADEDNNEKIIQIVGPDEIDPAKGKITFSSPLGKAILGKKVDEEFTVKTPQGNTEYKVLSIHRSRSECQ